MEIVIFSKDKGFKIWVRIFTLEVELFLGT
jgi:hypothetical protein